MKTRNLYIELFIILLFFSACRDITVRTTVNDDGTFTRTITVKGDSAEAFNPELPYPVDSSWEMTSREDTAGKGKYTVIYTKQYRTCDELQAEIGSDTSWKKQLARQVAITKRFGFFYSYLHYKEVYPAANPFRSIPYKDRLTPEDISWLMRRHAIQNPSDSARSKAADDKAIAYLEESAALVVENILTDAIGKLNNPGLDAAQVHDFRDSIRSYLANAKFIGNDAIIDAYRQWTGNPAADRLKELKPALFADFAKKYRFVENFLGMEGFKVEAEMPGLITGTNSTVLNGNRVSWELFPMAFLLEDYTMEVESRVINVWAFVLAGLVLLAFVGLLAVRSMKR